MAASLLHGLKVDFSLKWSRSNSFSSFLKYHFNLNILPSASYSVLSFTSSIVLEVRIKLSPFDNKDVSEPVRLRLDKFTTFLPTKLPCNLLSNIFAALSFTFNLLSKELVFTSRISTELSVTCVSRTPALALGLGPSPGRRPQFVFDGPGPQFVFNGPGPHFVFICSSFYS